MTHPEDHPDAPRQHPACHSPVASPMISVIIPVLHEAATINECIAHVKGLECCTDVEILVVDALDVTGTGDTLAALAPEHLAPEAAVRVHPLRAPRGRANQMNAGAAQARGHILVFLHADTRLPPAGLILIWQALFPPRGGKPAQAGAFSLGYAEGGLLLECMARLASLRNRLTGTPYGDQAQFFRTETFHAMGGYPAIPLMEDVDIMRTLHRRGEQLVILPQRVATSARRYRADGLLWAGLRNNGLRLLHACGVPPQALTHWYRAFQDKS
ncbi:TIGR04283 family arsenosugar biosynthesis glycosyltransferase [Megalodesulfovibrio gigas]|uniref:Putative glycosyl transferase group family protein n=1 Tax=Megalodesulfovibrio gigas (strain ATCC 19364 / DSM 1382 / NCIMB 9332 / VKM B-1759) TaxID=1121448 RepID=T2G8W2_MEGG1|nr:TIGR04283 family arsenosugar biosynthesis glycosyltransferase [Megalodesulfovibrio gigas]AGW12599.1 putative glycosyl transferase group family protein [Megalodesulfovibrio gigas DSM 1382 = ATCC 19364]